MQLILFAALFFMILTTFVLIRNRFEFTSIADVRQDTISVKKVSICIPARNEEANIGRCVESVLAQTYPNVEVLVLDDQSEDRTPEILKELSDSDSRLKVLSGTPKPDDWLGKPWACHQISKAATGDILVFLDADVWIEPKTISKAVQALNFQDSITIWPQQKVESFWENIIVPTVYFSLLTLLPSVYVHRSPRWMPKFLQPFLNPKFVAACGQFIAFNKSAYEQLGGHERVQNQVVEDMELARALKNSGLSIRMYNGIDAVYCRMYTSYREIWSGFQKNFLAGFGNTFEFIFMGLVHVLFFLMPIVTLFIGIELSDTTTVWQSAFILSLFTLQRFILNQWFGWNKLFSFLHPLAVMWFQILGISCLYNKVFARNTRWKGRPV
ncbi:MAG: glycosyltransferase [Balneolaceae bacterium]|nr:glycosyltransferase [Balneolaceae bacterium]